MISKLIPWKKKNDIVGTRHDDHPMLRLRRDFDELFDRFWDDWWQRDLSVNGDWTGLGSRMDLEDDEKEFVIHAELPGFEPDDFDVSISGNMLTIKAEHLEEGEEKNGNYRRYGNFYESFTLPEGVLSDEIDARYHSGVLEIHLPKSEDFQSKRIEVKNA